MYLMDRQDRRLATELSLNSAISKARQLAVQHGKIYIRDCLGGLRAEVHPLQPTQQKVVCD